jgi:hypothetical protein
MLTFTIGKTKETWGIDMRTDGLSRERSTKGKSWIGRVAYYWRVMHYALGPYPSLFFPLHRLREPESAHHQVRAGVDLVIEGFPRSGNTFAEIAFKLVQPNTVHTADHLHVPAQIVRAARLGVPTCVLIRHPADVARSLVVKYPDIRVCDAIRGYAMFYSRCLRWRQHFVVAEFEEVTADFGHVVERVNERFGTNFVSFSHTAKNVAKVNSLLDERNLIFNGGAILASYRPNGVKAMAKQEIDLSGHARLLDRSLALYDRYRSLAREAE